MAVSGRSWSRLTLKGVEMTADFTKPNCNTPITTRAESLDYFRTLSIELATLARKCGLPVLANLFDMAAEEAALELKRVAS